jgi:hypothetical protein
VILHKHRRQGRPHISSVGEAMQHNDCRPLAPDPDVNDRAVRMNRLCSKARRKGLNFSCRRQRDQKRYECAEKSTRNFISSSVDPDFQDRALI